MKKIFLSSLFLFVLFFSSYSLAKAETYSDWFTPDFFAGTCTESNLSTVDASACVFDTGTSLKQLYKTSIDTTNIIGIEYDIYARWANADGDTTITKFVANSNQYDIDSGDSFLDLTSTYQTFTGSVYFTNPLTGTQSNVGLGLIHSNSSVRFQADKFLFRYIYDAPAPAEPEDPNTCVGWTPLNAHFSWMSSGFYANKIDSLDETYTDAFPESTSNRAWCLMNSEVYNCTVEEFETKYATNTYDYIKYRIFTSPDTTTETMKVTYNQGASGALPFQNILTIPGAYNYIIAPISTATEEFQPRVSINNQYGGTLKIDHIQFNLCNEDVTTPPDPIEAEREYNPTLELVSADIDELLGYARVFFRGDTDYTSETAVCRVIIGHRAVRPNGSSSFTSSVSTIELIASDPQTETIELSDVLGASAYLGYFFSPTESRWNAYDVLVPYDSGATNTYNATYQCTDEEEIIYNYQSIDPSSPGYYQEEEYNLEDAGTVSVIEDCDTLDIACKLTNWALQFFRFTQTSEKFDYYRTQLANKVPFVYATAVYNIDLEGTTPEDSIGILELNSNGLEYNVDFMAAMGSFDFMQQVRQFFSGMIYLIGLFYLISVPGRFIGLGK